MNKTLFIVETPKNQGLCRWPRSVIQQPKGHSKLPSINSEIDLHSCCATIHLLQRKLKWFEPREECHALPTNPTKLRTETTEIEQVGSSSFRPLHHILIHSQTQVIFINGGTSKPSACQLENRMFQDLYWSVFWEFQRHDWRVLF